MPRYFRPSKSNFHSMFTDYQYISSANHPEVVELEDYLNKNYSEEVGQLILKYSSEVKEYPKTFGSDDQLFDLIFMALYTKNPDKNLRLFVEPDKDSSFPYHHYYLLRFLLWLVINTGRDDDGEFPPEFLDSNEIVDGKSLNLLIRVAFETMENFPSRSIQPMDASVADEVSNLIDGYLIYWERVSKSSESKRSICKYVEEKNGVSNVRQEYDRFDTFFEKMEDYIKDNVEHKISDFRLDATVRTMICRLCLKFAMRPIPF